MAKQPAPPKTPKTRHAAHSMSPINIGCWAAMVVALLGTGFGMYRASQSVAPPVVVATPTPTPSVPALVLHQQHARQGPVITVNPSQIGKPDPFQ